jgi:hypothetical protein
MDGLAITRNEASSLRGTKQSRERMAVGDCFGRDGISDEKVASLRGTKQFQYKIALSYLVLKNMQTPLVTNCHI